MADKTYVLSDGEGGTKHITGKLLGWVTTRVVQPQNPRWTELTLIKTNTGLFRVHDARHSILAGESTIVELWSVYSMSEVVDLLGTGQLAKTLYAVPGVARECKADGVPF